MSNRSSRSESHSSVLMLKSMVRQVLVVSVAWTSLLVKFQMSHESTVPQASSPRSARIWASGTLSRSQRSLVAEK